MDVLLSMTGAPYIDLVPVPRSQGIVRATFGVKEVDVSSGSYPVSRSTAPLHPFAVATSARIGRYDAELVSLAPDEARLRHSGALKVGTEVVLSYSDGIRRVQASAIVRSCHVLALGGGLNGATLYESLVGIQSQGETAVRGSDRS